MSAYFLPVESSHLYKRPSNVPTNPYSAEAATTEALQDIKDLVMETFTQHNQIKDLPRQEIDLTICDESLTFQNYIFFQSTTNKRTLNRAFLICTIERPMHLAALDVI